MKSLTLILLLSSLMSAYSAEGEENLSFTQLQEIITRNKVTSIDQLIPLLPLEYRKHYTLMYQSQSAQAETTTPDYPRAIVFGERSTFVMTFTKGNTLETMEWKAETKSFQLRELTFNGATPPIASEPNPQKCLTCHGSDPRPIWESFNLWPGAYGSISLAGCDAMKEGSLEHQYFRSFLNTGKKSPRYKDLPTPTNEILGFCTPEKGISFVGNGGEMDANSVLSEAFGDLNVLRIQRMVGASPEYETYKYAMAAISKDCGDVASREGFEGYFSPAALSAGRQLGDLEKIVHTNRARDLNSLSETFHRTNSETGPPDADHIIVNENNFITDDYVARMRFLLERLGVPWEKISLSFSGTDTFLGPGSQVRFLKSFLSSKDEGLKEKSCAELKTLSLTATRNAQACAPSTNFTPHTPTVTNLATTLSVATTEASIANTMTSLNACKNCHMVGRSGGFKLNLQSRETLQAQLRAEPELAEKIRDYLRGFRANGEKVTRMPLNRPPFPQDAQEAIARDLEFLSH